MLSTTSPAAFAVYERLRSVERPDSPLPGVLARAADGTTVLLVDREAVHDWPGWGAAGETHILTPLDLIRRADGHDVVVPALIERVTLFSERRSDAEAPLSPGEAVTLSVSILRGLAPSLMRAGDIAGEWWLAEDGRPLLVEGVGDLGTRESSAEILSSIAEGMPRTRLGATLRELAEALQHPDFAHTPTDWEERLFACADPEPLVTEVLGPLRARRLAAEPPSVAEGPPPSLWQRLAFHVDADLASAASDAASSLIRRLRRSSPRPRPLLIAAGLAIAVAAVGLSWPTDADDAVPIAATSPTASVADTSSTPPPQETASSDAASVTAQLLDRRNGCGDTACLASVLEDPALVLPAGVVDDPSDQRRTTLLDDLGGLVVVRVDSLVGRPVQLVTVVETGDGWRIRDVHDVTDAPS